MRFTISTLPVRTVLQWILGIVAYTILLVLMFIGTVLLMSVLEPSFFSNWF